MAASLLLLLLFAPTLSTLAVFAVLYGSSNGVMTILRGTAVAEVFGRERYAELNGALSLPAVLAKAASPFALAALWTVTGDARSIFAGILVMVVVGAFGLHVVRRAASNRNEYRLEGSIKSAADVVTEGSR